jgi:hypothetical protein
LPQQLKRINLLRSVGNSSKQMQQTSGSSGSNRNGGDETVVDEAAVAVVAVNEGTMDEVALVVSVSSLLMVCANCDRSNGRVEQSFDCVLR